MLQLPSASAAEPKLGYVDAARLLEEAPQASAASNQLKQEFASREKEIINAQRELKELEDKLARDGVIMSETEQKKLELDVLSGKRELRRKQEELKEDFNIRRNDEIGKLQKFIKQAIEDVGKEGEFDLIFYEGISFANPKLDITDQVLKRLGAETKETLEKPPRQ
jgi:outer membrane protein